MLSQNDCKQNKFIFTTLEMLMPKEHFLRDLEQYVDFTFIYDKVSHLYSSMGRKSIDPVVLVKMLLLGFLYGIDSERKLEKEVEVNIAFRWFLGIDLDETVPDHSTISQTRRGKWRGTDIFEDIFTTIVKKCIENGLVDGSLILTDSTHVKASASDKSRETVTVTLQPREYIEKLDRLCEQEELAVRADAIAKGKKKSGYESNKEPKTRDIVRSTTDPDCGLLGRPGKPGGFHYLSHQSVDSKVGIITDVFVTPANTEDFEPYVDRIKHQIEKYGFNISEVGIDSGYDFEEIHKGMYDLGIKTYVPLVEMGKTKHNKVFPINSFHFDDTINAYLCPNGCWLKYSNINRNRHKKVYRASQKDCLKCPLRAECFSGNGKCRTLQISMFKKEVELQRTNFGTTQYYEIQRKRRIFCEGNFAIQKDNHNLRRTRKRGNERVTEHCLCSAMALNLKRLVYHLKTKNDSLSLIVFLLFRCIQKRIRLAPESS